jgi:hypothetical protein
MVDESTMTLTTNITHLPEGYTLTNYTCQCKYSDCLHVWESRLNRSPKVCPKCKRYDWKTGEFKRKSKNTINRKYSEGEVINELRPGLVKLPKSIDSLGRVKHKISLRAARNKLKKINDIQNKNSNT